MDCSGCSKLIVTATNVGCGDVTDFEVPVDVPCNGWSYGVGPDAIEFELPLVESLPRDELYRSTILYAVGGNYPEKILEYTTCTVSINALCHVK